MDIQKDVARGIAKTALHLIKKDANTACLFFFYQPKAPEGVKELCKFK